FEFPGGHCSVRDKALVRMVPNKEHSNFLNPVWGGSVGVAGARGQFKTEGLVDLIKAARDLVGGFLNLINVLWHQRIVVDDVITKDLPKLAHTCQPLAQSGFPTDPGLESRVRLDPAQAKTFRLDLEQQALNAQLNGHALWYEKRHPRERKHGRYIKSRASVDVLPTCVLRSVSYGANMSSSNGNG
ncbi:MAG: hypothetical protein RMK51_11355, partial [Meiothermus sp.]|nr:hypothetical protein [Meiothermus sp.]